MYTSNTITDAIVEILNDPLTRGGICGFKLGDPRTHGCNENGFEQILREWEAEYNLDRHEHDQIDIRGPINGIYFIGPTHVIEKRIKRCLSLDSSIRVKNFNNIFDMLPVFTLGAVYKATYVGQSTTAE